MALDKQRLLAENDFGKLLNFVVADGQTLHIVFLLTYGQRRRDNVLGNKRANTISILFFLLAHDSPPLVIAYLHAKSTRN